MSGGLETNLRERFCVVETVAEYAGRTFRMLRPRSADELIDEAEFNADERLPYWAEIWPSARVLAEHVATLEGCGKRLLELGAGVGLPSLVAAERGFDVLASDYYEPACEFIRLNAARHELTVATRSIDWRALPPALGEFDTILAADVLYERPYCELVAGVIGRLLRATGEAWLTDPGRERAAGLPAACQAGGLTVTQVKQVLWNDGVNRPTVELYQITRKGCDT